MADTAADTRQRQIAIVLYEGFTALDAVGPYEMLGGIPGARQVFVAERPGPVRNDSGSLSLIAEAAFEDVPGPDLIVVPGGPPDNVRAAIDTVTPWLRTADSHSSWTTSVCTGSLLLAAAGLLTGRRATSHWLALQSLRELGGALPVSERVVIDGKYMTAAGVSAGIDMGLTLVGLIAGERTAQTVQLMTEYDPRPPYDAGSARSAPAELVAQLRQAEQ